MKIKQLADAIATMAVATGRSQGPGRRRCLACGEPLPPGSHGRRKFCPEKCDHKRRPAPAIYRFVCPDGRSYVGSAADIRTRNRSGLSRSNRWIDKAIATYPLAT